MANKLDGSGKRLCAAILAALLGLIVYIITSTTGFLAASVVAPTPIVCTVSAIILVAALLFIKKMPLVINDLVVVAAAVLLMVSFAFFALSRVTLVADVYFIPVNYPQAEETALNISLVGLVLYLVAIVTMIVEAFMRTNKD